LWKQTRSGPDRTGDNSARFEKFASIHIDSFLIRREYFELKIIARTWACEGREVRRADQNGCARDRA
jgi:hypothetical protein